MVTKAQNWLLVSLLGLIMLIGSLGLSSISRAEDSRDRPAGRGHRHFALDFLSGLACGYRGVLGFDDPGLLQLHELVDPGLENDRTTQEHEEQ